MTDGTTDAEERDEEGKETARYGEIGDHEDEAELEVQSRPNSRPLHKSLFDRGRHQANPRLMEHGASSRGASWRPGN